MVRKIVARASIAGPQLGRTTLEHQVRPARSQGGSETTNGHASLGQGRVVRLFPCAAIPVPYAGCAKYHILQFTVSKGFETSHHVQVPGGEHGQR